MKKAPRTFGTVLWLGVKVATLAGMLFAAESAVGRESAEAATGDVVTHGTLA